MTSSESSTHATGSPGRATAALHPSMVLSAYLDPLVRGRRVAVLGDATIGLAERLLQRGARLVHAYDPEAPRVAEMLARTGTGRQHHPTYAVFDGDLGVRDGAFDTLVIPDLSLFKDPAEILRRARRLTAAGGAAVVASPNPDAARALLGLGAARAPAPGYYALYDLVSLQFKHVRMIGQAPFVGYTVADFAPNGEPDVSVDTSLLDGTEEPEWFIALAGERPVRLDPFAVIEIPFADFPAASSGVSLDALSEVEGRAARLGTELTELRARQLRDRADAGTRADTANVTAARLAEVEAELKAKEARLAEVVPELAAKEARLRDVEARAGDAHVRAERFSHQIRDMEEELRNQRDRGTRLTKQLDDEKRARTKVELELGMIRNKPEIAGARDRLDSATAELEAARARIAELEALPKAASPDPALAQRIEELEAAVAGARRESARASGERDAARKRAQESERSLEEAQRARREAATKLAELGAELAALGRGRAASEERAGRLEREKRALEEQRAALDARRQVLEARIVELEQRTIDLEKLHAELEPRDLGDAAAAEIAALEAALRERGHVIAALQAELRESERVGKELVDELGAPFDAPGGEHAPGGAQGAGGGGEAGGGLESGSDGPNGLRQQLDALARSAAVSEADLRAAGWKIAQLERELAEARDATASPATRHLELEQALVAARAEIASMRRAPPAPALQVSPEVVEQSVLLQQIAGAFEAGL
jgi:predicted  nucleic acid-binding Zn-ribbon protein